MENISTADARRQLAELLNRSAYGKERFVVTRHGKEMVAIVPVEDLDLLEKVRSLLRRQDVRAALQEAADDELIAWDELREELDL